MDDRELLNRLARRAASGAELAAAAGVSRAAIWKRIERLRTLGVPVRADRGSGYRLDAPLDWLDAAGIRNGLDAAVRAQLASLEVVWSVPSTNTVLLAAGLPEQGCRVLLAETQTAGRGRRGRSWQTPLGAGLALSVARRFDVGLARLGGVALAAGAAVAQALQAQGVPAVTLKWPNDIHIDGRKAGGLLVEGGGEANGPCLAVIGLGLNVRMPRALGAGIDQPWTDLAAGGVDLPRDRWAVAVLDHLLPMLARFDAEGIVGILPVWRRFDGLIGREVSIHDARHGQARVGRALGIADDGALRVRIGDGEQRLHAGDVSVRAQ